MDEQNKSDKTNLSRFEKITLFTGIIALVITSCFSAYTLYQNSQNIEQNAQSIKQNAQSIETARAAFEVSVEPTIEITLPENYGDSLSIRNTSTINLTDIRAYPICYNIKGRNGVFKVINRQTLPPVTIPFAAFYPQQHAEIPLQSVSCAQAPKSEKQYVNALVVVFHRQQDNKRFVKVEPFVMSDKELNPGWASSVYWEGWSGDPSIILGLTAKIKETEAVFFRVDK